MLKPLHIVTAAAILAFGLVSTFVFACINFNDNAQTQDNEKQTQTLLGLDGKELVLTCNLAYFVQILLEVPAVALVLRGIAQVTNASPMFTSFSDSDSIVSNAATLGTSLLGEVDSSDIEF